MSFLKVQLNLYDEDIACHFGIHKSIVLRVLGILCTHRSLIKWPDRETLSMIMRTSFKIFVRKCAAIIDCLEVFIEMPANLLTRAQV